MMFCCGSVANNYVYKPEFLRREVENDHFYCGDEGPSISGTIPSELGRLTGLTSLDICKSGSQLACFRSFMLLNCHSFFTCSINFFKWYYSKRAWKIVALETIGSQFNLLVRTCAFCSCHTSQHRYVCDPNAYTVTFAWSPQSHSVQRLPRPVRDQFDSKQSYIVLL